MEVRNDMQNHAYDTPIVRKTKGMVPIKWRETIVTLGAPAPVVVQSMTDTDTQDINATVQQISELALAGSELVRITVNTPEAARAVPKIREQLDQSNISVPLIGDFHYNGHTLLNDYPECAQTLSKYRINPGNVGYGAKHDTQFAKIIEIACLYDKPVRIGVNGGSLDQQLLAHLMDGNAKNAQPLTPQCVMHEALITSALTSAQAAQQIGLPKERIVLSCKVSAVQHLVSLYRELAQRCDYVLHLGLTEAGIGTKGIIASTAGLALLLQQGIGDTIRVSLTPKPGAARTEEVRVAQYILQTMGIRSFMPMVTSCPGCGRTSSVFFRSLAENIQDYLIERIAEWKKHYLGVEHLQVAVMGCIVNGPGESKQANIGISLPGSGENPRAPVFIDDNKVATLHGESIIDEFKSLIEHYVQQKYTQRNLD